MNKHPNDIEMVNRFVSISQDEYKIIYDACNGEMNMNRTTKLGFFNALKIAGKAILENDKPRIEHLEGTHSYKKLLELEQAMAAKHENVSYGGNLVSQLESHFRYFANLSQRHYESYGVLIDEMRINVRALQMLADEALNQETHKRKNQRLYALKGTIDTIVLNLSEIDQSNTSWWDDFAVHNRGMDYRYMAAENMRLRRELELLKNPNTDDEESEMPSFDFEEEF